ncbi:MAG TPA: hypothetical protein DCP63_06230 [Bacteroidetes bacterium]|nr:hypothetical protein [Bacteroidota bacterium]
MFRGRPGKLAEHGLDRHRFSVLRVPPLYIEQAQMTSVLSSTFRPAACLDLRERIQQGVDFLFEGQLDWGEFPVYGFTKSPKEGKVYEMTVFPTTFALHALSFVRQSEKVSLMRRKGTEFLLDHLEEPGICRYYGRHSILAPDLDDTACVLAALIENGRSVADSLFDHLDGFRDRETKLFRTWMGPAPVCENDIDSVVNANVLFLYGLSGKCEKIDEVVHYLNADSNNLHTQNSQVWYYSPQAYAYMVSRAYADGGVKELLASRDPLCDYLLFTQQEHGGWSNALETAFAVTALLNFGYDGPEVVHALENLCRMQDRSSGAWPSEFVYVAAGSGSQEFTTSICLEALAKSGRSPD